MKNSKILFVLITCIILYLIPNIFYIFKFGNTNLSSIPSDWGVYGDFIGGSINPLLTILNIFALVYLTYTVSHIEDKRAEKQDALEDKRTIANINAQKLITLNQMRFEAVSELSRILNSIPEITFGADISNNSIKLVYLLTSTISFRYNQKHLFIKLFNEDFDTRFYKPLEQKLQGFINYSHKNPLDGKISKELSEIITEIYGLQSSFLSKLNKFILDELSPQ